MRYFFAFLVFLLLIVVGLIFIFSRHKSTPKKPIPVVKTLPDYADGSSSVNMLIDGIVNGEDLHRGIRVTVTRDQRRLDIIQGYSGHVISTQTQPNTKDAYEVFLRALSTAGFTTKMKNTKAPNDPRGICPEGTRDIFTLTDGGNTVSNLWSSTCGVGTFGGNPDIAQSLFKRQITNYDQLTANVDL